MCRHTGSPWKNSLSPWLYWRGAVGEQGYYTLKPWRISCLPDCSADGGPVFFHMNREDGPQAQVTPQRVSTLQLPLLGLVECYGLQPDTDLAN